MRSFKVDIINQDVLKNIFQLKNLNLDFPIFKKTKAQPAKNPCKSQNKKLGIPSLREKWQTISVSFLFFINKILSASIISMQ